MVQAANFPSHESQKTEINDILNRNVETGQSWYAIDIKWFNHWENYVRCEFTPRQFGYYPFPKSSTIPGPIDNRALVKDGKFKLSDLTEGKHYTLLPGEAWNKLRGWYGLTTGSVEIKVYVVT